MVEKTKPALTGMEQGLHRKDSNNSSCKYQFGNIMRSLANNPDCLLYHIKQRRINNG